MYGVLFAAFLFVSCQIARLIATVWRDEAYFSCNAWGAFSVPFSESVLFVLGLVACALFFYGWHTAENFAEEWLWLMLIAGGASNLFERLTYGCVTDYVSFGWLPMFNGADVMLTVAVGVLLWRVFFRDDTQG